MTLHLHVVSTAFNAASRVTKCLDSVRTQRLPHDVILRHTYISDNSTDGTGDIAAMWQWQHPAELLDLRVGGWGTSLENLWRVISVVPQDDIILWLDGDDELRPGAAARVAEEYRNPDTWATYGSYVFQPSGVPGYASLHPPEIVSGNLYRVDHWRASHLRTFRAGLFQCLRARDLQRLDGRWITRCTDQAVMLPLLEMAGPHARFIPDALVDYWTDHPNCDMTNETIRAEGVAECRRIRETMPRYDRLTVRPW